MVTPSSHSYLFLAFCAMALFLYLPFLNDFKDSGELKIPGLKDRVTIQRDANGMAYIHARMITTWNSNLPISSLKNGSGPSAIPFLRFL